MPQQNQVDLSDLGAKPAVDLSDLGAKPVAGQVQTTEESKLKRFGRAAYGMTPLPLLEPPKPEEAGAAALGPGALAATRLVSGAAGILGQVPEFLKYASERIPGMRGATPAQAPSKTLEEFKTIAPELTGMVTGGLATAAIEPAVRGAGTATRIGVQEIAGAGKEPVLAATRATEMRIAQLSKEYADKVAKSQTEYKKATEVSEQAGVRKDIEASAEHTAKVEELKAAAAEKERIAVAEYERKVAEVKAAHAEKAAAARAEWVRNTLKVRGVKEEAARVEARRQVIGEAKGEYTRLIKENADQTQAAVKQGLDARWEDFRNKVGRETPLNGGKVYNAIAEAEAKYLRGAPETVKAFKDLLNEIGVGHLMKIEEAEHLSKLSPQASDIFRSQMLPLDLETARVHSSTIGDRMYSGDLPGNIYKSLQHVQNALESEIMSAAEAKGQGANYAKLKFDWSQYMKDWHDMRSLAVGGSPMARITRAQDPAFVSAQVLGKAGERLIQIAAKYKTQGASPQMIAKLRNLQREYESLPKIRVPSEPEKPVIGEPKLPPLPQLGAVKLPEPPTPSVREIPTRKAVEPPKLPVKKTPVEIRRKILETKAGRPFGWWEIFPPYLIEHLALKSPTFREWVARQPRSGE